MSVPRELTLFDFGLDAEQEARAQRLHQESIIIDMLFQGPVGAATFTEEMTAQTIADFEKHRDYWRSMVWALGLPARMAARDEFPEFKEWWDLSGVTAGNRQLDTDTPEGVMPTLAVATLQFDRLDWLVKALTADDIRRAKVQGKHAGFISAQNTVALGQKLDNINTLHELGLRMLQLSYNNMNFVASGCTERTDAGVSTFGARFIERMNELGIIVDTGHCGRQATLDACELSQAPVVASHTCAQAISGHARGKSDAEIEALAATGGVIGVVTLPGFLSAEPSVTLEHFLDHIDHIVKRVGYQHVGIGTDWPMCLPEWGIQMMVEQLAPTIGFRPEDRMGTVNLVGFEDYRHFINITRGLVARGYRDEQIRAILGGNWLRVMEQVWN